MPAFFSRILAVERGLHFLGELCHHEIVTVPDERFEMWCRHHFQIGDTHPVAFRAVGGLGNAVDRGELVKFFGCTFEDDCFDDFSIERDDQKHFSRYLEDQAFTPLFNHRGLGQRESEFFKPVKAHGGNRLSHQRLQLVHDRGDFKGLADKIGHSERGAALHGLFFAVSAHNDGFLCGLELSQLSEDLFAR